MISNDNVKMLLGLLILLGFLVYLNQSDTVKNQGSLKVPSKLAPVASQPKIRMNDVDLSDFNPEAPDVQRNMGGSTGPDVDEWDQYFNENNSVIGKSQLARSVDRFSAMDETSDQYAKYSGAVKRNARKKPVVPDGSFDPDMYDPLNLLPREKHEDWFETIDGPVTLKDEHLINLQQPLGINTVASSLKNASHDLRGSPPNPKMAVSPWMNSTIEPDYNIKSWCY